VKVEKVEKVEKLEKQCKQCGASYAINCPVAEEDFCEKKKAITCPSCQYVELEEDYPTKCNHPGNEAK